MSDLFNEQGKLEDQPITPASPTTASTDVFANQLAQITNERGEPKYASLDKAIEALKHSQEYIPQLKSQLTEKDAELQQLRESLAKTAGIEETIARLSQQRQEEHLPATSGLDENSVLALVQKTLSQRDQQSVRDSNLVSVSNALTGKYGDKAREVLSAKAQELNMSMEQMKTLSQDNPALVLTLFQTSSSSPTGAPQRSSVHLEQRPEERTPPKKSLLRGSSMKEQAAYMKQIKDEIYRKHGIDS